MTWTFENYKFINKIPENKSSIIKFYKGSKVQVFQECCNETQFRCIDENGFKLKTQMKIRRNEKQLLKEQTKNAVKHKVHWICCNNDSSVWNKW